MIMLCRCPGAPGRRACPCVIPVDGSRKRWMLTFIVLLYHTLKV